MTALPKIAELLHPVTESKIRALAGSMTPQELVAILSDWSMWRLPYQTPPPEPWRRWVMRMGRGTGKTHTGASTCHDVARQGKSFLGRGDIGIIGRTYQDARFTMVEGPSGIVATASIDFKPTWEPGNMLLRWPNGVKGRLYTSDKPEGIRGGNLGFVWADEPAHWKWKPDTWHQTVEFALRMGKAQAVLTTTPLKTDPLLRALETMGDTVTTTASTLDNPFLTTEIRTMFENLYKGTTIGRQEMGGEYIDDVVGALWSADLIDPYRVSYAPELARVVVALDPAVTSNKDSDETGVIVAGISHDGHGYVLQDKSATLSPLGWARAGVGAYKRWHADRVIAEVNNGGDLVETNLRIVDPNVSYKSVRATRGKEIRAEPIVALYERGMIHHVGAFPELEKQLTQWVPSEGKSPDRLDALVWALHELFIDAQQVGPLSAYTM